MVLCEKWLEIFNNGWRNEDTLVRILRETEECLKNIPNNQRDASVEVILNNSHGLFMLIRKILNYQNVNRKVNFDNILIECLNVLQLIIKYIKFSFKPYIIETVDICFNCIVEYRSKKELRNVRLSASRTLEMLIETFNISYDKLVDKIIKKIRNIDRQREIQISKKEQEDSDEKMEMLYLVYSSIVKNHPKTKNLTTSIEEIYVKLLFSLKHQCHLLPQNTREEDIKIDIKCIVNMFTNFVPFTENKSCDYLKKLFSFLLFLNENCKENKIRCKILHFLSENINYFIEFLIEKFEFWHNSFLEICKEELKIIYHAIVFYLLNNDDKNVFMYLKNYLLENIINTNLSPTDLSLEVYGLGQLTIVTGNYSMDKCEFDKMLQVIRNFSLSFSERTDIANRSYLLYLETLSDIMYHLQYLVTQYLEIYMDLTSICISTFPQLKSEDQILLSKILKRTLEALENPNTTFFEQFVNFLVQTLIKKSCQYGLSCDIHLQMVVGNIDAPSFRNFLPLWNTFLKSNAEKENSDQRIFEKTINILFSSLEELDLKLMKQEKLPFCSSKAAERNINFRYYVNLFDLFIEIFGIVDIVILKLWIDKLLVSLIKYSYKYPSMSVYYKLITALFKRLEINKLVLKNNVYTIICEYIKDIAPILSTVEAVQEVVFTYEKTFANYRNNFPLIAQSLESLKEWKNKIESKYQENNEINCFCKNNFVNMHEFGWNNLGQVQILNFQDMDLKIHLEKLLPQVLENENRATKFSAHTVFHNILILILGNKLENQYLNEKVFVMTLKFGCDPDEAIANLFHPLIMQFCYYLNTESLKESNISYKFIDALFVNLTDTSTTLQKYCGICLQEFVYSIRNSSEPPKKSSIFHYIVLKIINLASSKSLNYRISAAVAFNYLFTLCTEHDGAMGVMKRYWLELVLAFLTDINDYVDPQIERALENIKNVFQATIDTVSAVNNQMRISTSLGSDTIEAMIIELFHIQICEKFDSTKVQYWLRFIESLCPCTPEIKTLNFFIKTCGIIKINKITAEGLGIYDNIEINNITSLMRGLKLYTWILQKTDITSDLIFGAESSKNETFIFFKFLNKFIITINNNDITERNDLKSKKLIALINHTILQIVNFLTIILSKEVNNLSSELDNLLTNNMFVFIHHLVLDPKKIGLTGKTRFTMENNILDNMLVAIKEHLPAKYLTAMEDIFINEMHLLQNITDLVNFENKVHTRQDFINGIIRLRKLEVFDFMKEERNVSKKIITEIFEKLEQIEECVLRDRWEKLIKFFLIDYQPDLIEFLINLIFGEQLLDESIVARGKYFFNTFESSILQSLLKNPDESLNIVQKVLQSQPDKMFFLIEKLLLYSYHNQDLYSEMLADNVMKKFDIYKNLIFETQMTEARLFNIYRLVVLMISENIVHSEELPSGLYQWILTEFETAQNLDRKSILLDCFLACMIDKSSMSKKGRHLSCILDKLDPSTENTSKTERRNNFEKNTVERLQRLNCLRILLKQFLNTNSLIILEGIVKFSAGFCKLFFAEIDLQKYLTDYYSTIPNELAANTLEYIYTDLFMNLNFGLDERLEILDYFLLPSIELCQNVTEFYRNNYSILANRLILKKEYVSAIKRKQLIVTSIASYKLFEIMFVKLPIDLVQGLRVHNESLDSCILDKATDIRSVPVKNKNIEDKELTRLLHCAALNCYIARVCAKPDESKIKTIFAECDSENRYLWQNIIDDEKTYTFNSPEPKFSTRFINIPMTKDQKDSALELKLEIYLSDCDVSKPRAVESRQSIPLINDDLNDHECMAMISGAIVHIENIRKGNRSHASREIITPSWLEPFENIMNTVNVQRNVKLFLFRVIVNARQALSIYMDSSLFRYTVAQVNEYLEDNTMNYLIRDVILLVLERKCTVLDEIEREHVQTLRENVIRRAVNDEDHREYERNVDLIEKLMEKYGPDLEFSYDFELPTETSPDLALRVGLILFRNNFNPKMIMTDDMYVIVRKAMFKWMEPLAPQVFEFIGWMLRYHSKDFRNKVVKDDLEDIFTCMQNTKGNDFCFGLLYRTLMGCPDLALYDQLKPFMDPTQLKTDECKAQSFEIFLSTMKYQEPNDIAHSLERTKLRKLLRDRAFPCLEIGFKIVNELAKSFNAEALLSFAEVLEQYTDKSESIEYKNAAYDFFFNLYSRYVNDIPETDNCTDALIELCVKVLINGVTDPDDEVQDRVLTFWKTNAGLSDSSSERVQHLLQLYSPEVHESFAQFVCLLILDLTKKSPESKKVLCNPLGNNTFRDYDILVPRTARRPYINAPEYAPSLAYFLQNSVNRNSINKIEETNELLNNLSLIDLERVMSKKKVSPDEGLEKNSVKINLRYRISDNGDNYPDVEITQSDLVTNLDDLTRRSKEFASGLIVTLICAIVKYFKTKNTDDEFIAVLTKFCKNVLKQPNDFVPMAMEIMYECDLTFDAKDLTRTAEAMKLQPLGILILEKSSINNFIYDSTKLKEIDKIIKNHLPLAKLYRSIGEHDVATRILKNWKLSPELEDLRQVPALEAECNWYFAKIIYEEIYEKENAREAKEYCMDGILECLVQLGSWSEVIQRILTFLPGNDFSSIWEYSTRNKFIPWIIKAQLYHHLQNIINDRCNSDSTFTKLLNEWFYTKKEKVIRPYGEELLAFHLFCEEIKSESIVQICLKSSFDEIAARMKNDREAKHELSNKLERLKEMERYIETLKAEDIMNAAKNFVKYWDKNFSKKTNDLSGCQLLTYYRLTFIHLLRKKLDCIVMDISSEENIQSHLTLSGLKERLKLANVALSNRNLYIFRRESKEILGLLDSLSLNDRSVKRLKLDFQFAIARYNFISGELKRDTRKKFQYYCKSLKICNDILSADYLSTRTKTKTHYHAFCVSNALLDLVKSEVEFALQNFEFIAKNLNIEESQIEGLEAGEILHKAVDTLIDYSCEKLENVCPESNARDSSTYAKFAEYLYAWIMTNELDTRRNRILKKFILTVFKAASLGSPRTHLLFICLFNPSFYKDNKNNANLFVSESKTVPTWMFLSLKDELIMQLTTALKPLVLPILFRLSEEFPCSIQFSFKSFYDSNPELKSDDDIQKIYKLIFADSKIEVFFKALEYLVEPEEYLRCRLIEAVHSENPQTFTNLIDSITSEISSNALLQGVGKNNLTQVFKSFEGVINDLKTVEDMKTIKTRIKDICSSLEERLHSRLSRKTTKFSELEEYSVYLSTFVGEELEIEIPLQYTYEINNSTRVTIARFDRFVEAVPDSTDLKIKVVGSDAKTYEFIVRYGIDLRREQRMQRIFEFMNTILDKDLNCQSRKLRLKPYNVVSVSRSIALIQCTDTVSSLKQIIYSSGGESTIQKISAEYHEWIQQSGSGASGKCDYYKSTQKLYRAKDVVSKMKGFISSMQEDFLRKAFVKCSHSPDHFFELRQNFVKNYATMCLVNWLTGIGDRRLENILVNLETGECYGINLDVIFGTHFHQRSLDCNLLESTSEISEVIPFRLTPQILKFIKPYSKQDLLATTMVHTLNALMNQKNVVLSCISAFLRENIWSGESSTLEKNWCPEQKIDLIEKKLNGMNERQSDHINLRNFNNNLPSEKLVHCLLDQASDLNVLGRMQTEWCPFV